MENRQHIQVSSEILKNKNLSNNDIGVYLAIGKYMNKDTKEAFPSQATLVKDTNLALQTVRNCIRKLKSAKAFEIEKRGRNNIYKFSKDETFEMFDYEFLNKQDLSLSEKGFIAKIQPHMIKDGQEGIIKYTYDELQDKTGLSVSTILRNNKSLAKKEYATIRIDEKIYHLDKLGQFIICALKNHEDRLVNNENEIIALKREISELKKQLDIKNSQDIKL